LGIWRFSQNTTKKKDLGVESSGEKVFFTGVTKRRALLGAESNRPLAVLYIDHDG